MKQSLTLSFDGEKFRREDAQSLLKLFVNKILRSAGVISYPMPLGQATVPFGANPQRSPDLGLRD